MRRDELRRAITAGRIRPDYQPIVSLEDGRVLRLEALARWHHRRRGIIPPLEFVPLAQRSGAVAALRDLMLRAAMGDLATWRSQLPDLRVAVNLSALSFIQRGLPNTVARILAEIGASPEWLTLEVTEDVVIAEPRAQEQIAALRAMGVRIELDDFGTGYSSLGYLQRLAIDAVKIDRRFVGPMLADLSSEKIVRAIIGLCHELGFETVAEGVEDKQTRDVLAALGCDSAQGYFIARPMPPSAMTEWLSERVPAHAEEASPVTAGPPRGRIWAERLDAEAYLAKPFGIDDVVDIASRLTG